MPVPVVLCQLQATSMIMAPGSLKSESRFHEEAGPGASVLRRQLRGLTVTEAGTADGTGSPTQ